MKSLTPDGLTSFIETAQRFLGLGPVDVLHQGIWCGNGCVAVEAARQGRIHVARFDLEGVLIDIVAFPEDSPYETSYHTTNNVRLVITTQLGSETTSEIAFALN